MQFLKVQLLKEHKFLQCYLLRVASYFVLFKTAKLQKNPELTGFFFLLFLHIKLKVKFLFIAEGVAYPNGEGLISL